MFVLAAADVRNPSSATSRCIFFIGILLVSANFCFFPRIERMTLQFYRLESNSTSVVVIRLDSRILQYVLG